MTHLSRPELWAKIEAYEFSDLQDGTRFKEYVQKSSGMSMQATESSIFEYRRFLYLSVVAPGETVPSQVVDEIWHIHLTHTQDYWDRFCPKVLGRKLHHIPSSVALDEAGGYPKTLSLYEKEFGTSAPHKYWPREKDENKWMLAVCGTVLLGVASAISENYLFLLGCIVTIPIIIKFSSPARSGSNHSRTGGSCGSCTNCSSCGGD